MHQVDDTRHQYVCLFHMVEQGRQPAFSLIDPKAYGFSYVLSGSAQLILHDGREIALHPGSFFQLHPEITQALYVDNNSDWRECSLSIYRDSYQRLLAIHSVRLLSDVFQIGIQPEIISAYKDCHDLFGREEAVNTNQAVHAVLHCLRLIYQAIDHLRNKDDFLTQAKYILTNEMSSRKSLQAIASEMDMNYHAFRRRFKDLCDVSPGDWQIQQRIRRAQTLITEMSIEDVAEELGYADRFIFSRQFKKVTGLSPKDYRKLMVTTQEQH